VRVRVLGLLAVGVRVDVEHDVADLPAGTLVHGDGVVGLEVLDVGGGQRPPHAVDVALLDVQLHVVLVGVVGHHHAGGGGRAVQALVVPERLVGDQLVDLPAGDGVRAGAGLRGDDLVVGEDLVGGEHVGVDDRAFGGASSLAGSASWAGSTSASTVGPTGLVSTYGKVWSLGSLRWNSTVRSSTISVLSRLPSR